MSTAGVCDGAVGAGVLGYSVVLNRVVPPCARIAANLAAAGAAVLAVRATGSSWADLGLDPRAAGRGARFGAAATAVVLVGTATLASAPPTRGRFERAHHVHAHPNPIFELALRIPVGTALCEELLFRSATLTAFARRGPRWRASLETAAVFGLWHVLPTLDALRAAEPATSIADPATQREIAGTVAVTALAGLAFDALRRCSGSVLAPVVAHTAINGAAFTAARLAGRRVRRNGS